MSSATATIPPLVTSWPDGFTPDERAVGGFAVREVAAPADAVFAWIRRLDLQPAFYPALRLVRRVGGPWPELAAGSKTSFVVGATFVPMVKVFQCDAATRSLVWGGDVPGLAIRHAFTVGDLGDGRSVVRSEELWVGPFARLTGLLTRGPIQKVQTQWCEAIVRAAAAHPGGPPTP